MQTGASKDDLSNSSSTKLTNAFLFCGVVAGPLFTVVGLIQAFTRPGFNLVSYPLSLLENGDLGWIQISNFVIAGLLYVASAIGMWREMRGSRGGTWGPLLIAVFGAGMVGAGIFHADPVKGFPPGTPASAAVISTQGIVHLILATLSLLALIAACFVLARRFAARRETGWMVYSVVTGVLSFSGFAVEVVGLLILNLAFVLVTLNAYVWVSVVAAKLLRGQTPIR